ncbi:MAG: hypothetical protein AAFR46_11570 [Pseudomonadota bacterium]
MTKRFQDRDQCQGLRWRLHWGLAARAALVAPLFGIMSALMAATAASEQADRAEPDPHIEIVIDRGPGTIELYMGMNAALMSEAFGLPPEALTDASGTVPFDDLRMGTWDIGDRMLASVGARIDAAPAGFEAMSLMVHPGDRRLPFLTPLDAMMAIAVCSVPTPETAPLLADLHAYVGYIAYPENAHAALSLALPQMGRAPLVITVRDHWTGRPVAQTRQLVADGGVLEIAPVGILARSDMPAGSFLAVALMVLGGATGTTLLVMRQSRRRRTG